MRNIERDSLASLTYRDGGAAARFLADANEHIEMHDIARRSLLGAHLPMLHGQVVLVAAKSQLAATILMLELDGVASRMLLLPPGLDPRHLPAIVAEAGVRTVVTDGGGFPAGLARILETGPIAGREAAPTAEVPRDVETEWVLFTSGTTGRPKMVVHSLASLSGPLSEGPLDGAPVWSTFYDVRRYGGLQMLLRALVGGGSMVFSAAGEPVADFLARAAAAGVTHISGTPSHWRLALMSPAISALAPDYVRLSGEVADQAVLDRLRAVFPDPGISHAFASTEAGVAFDVRDGLAGFPATLIEGDAGARIRVVDATLRLRGGRTATSLLGAGATALADPDGFVNTGDVVELVGDRYQFRGRREGVINVGGQKVYPEEIEAVINRHPDVRISHVWGRPNRITGAIVAADIVIEGAGGVIGPGDPRLRDIRATCRRELAAYKVPVTLRAVASLAVAPSGKLVRAHAGGHLA